MQKKQLSIVTKNSLSLSLRTQALHVLQFPIARMKVNNCEAQRWFHLISKCDMFDKPGKASVHKKKLVSFKEQLAIADRYKQTLPCSHAQNTCLSSRTKSLSLSLRTQALHVLQFPQRRWSDHTPFAVTTAKPRKGCITSLANLTYMLHVTCCWTSRSLLNFRFTRRTRWQCGQWVELQKVCAIVIVMVTESPGFEGGIERLCNWHNSRWSTS